jgi:hypothetical protein
MDIKNFLYKKVGFVYFSVETLNALKQHIKEGVLFSNPRLYLGGLFLKG